MCPTPIIRNQVYEKRRVLHNFHSSDQASRDRRVCGESGKNEFHIASKCISRRKAAIPTLKHAHSFSIRMHASTWELWICIHPIKSTSTCVRARLVPNSWDKAWVMAWRKVSSSGTVCEFVVCILRRMYERINRQSVLANCYYQHVMKWFAFNTSTAQFVTTRFTYLTRGQDALACHPTVYVGVFLTPSPPRCKRKG